MSALDNMAEVAAASLENLREEARRQLADLQQRLLDCEAERAMWQRAAEEAESWVPQPCECGCKRLVPNGRHGAMFAALGHTVEVGIEEANAMVNGFASAACRGRWIESHSANVLPFPAQQEGR